MSTRRGTHGLGERDEKRREEKIRGTQRTHHNQVASLLAT